MIRININKYMLILMVTVISTACKKLVQIDAPISQLATPSVFSSNATATSALLNIYQNMYKNDDFYSVEYETGNTGDEMTNYLAQNIPVFINALDPLAGYSPWTNSYNYIYQANSIIAGLQNNPVINLSVNNQLTGEARFVRALWNFYLVNFY